MKGELLKARDLKPLDDEGLLYLAVRATCRAEPWCPAGAEALWGDAISALVDAIHNGPNPRTLKKYGQAITERGVAGTYVGADKCVARSRHYAGLAVASALEAASQPLRKDRWKTVVTVGKYVASLFAIQAHAGVFPVDDALSMPWRAMRADIALIEHATLAAGAHYRPGYDELVRLGPLWAGGEPLWARPSQV